MISMVSRFFAALFRLFATTDLLLSFEKYTQFILYISVENNKTYKIFNMPVAFLGNPCYTDLSSLKNLYSLPSERPVHDSSLER